ncbi:hypothetical protein JTM43_07495 [Pseudomonas aeruginosa]|nr:hypothetical protein [Pseudomonas aeruginosa]MBN0489708.1 hypothetical protein [Pseudomonas aeruginosa]
MRVSLAVVGLVAALSGCASSPPDHATDTRPGGNQGLSLRDGSPDTWIFQAAPDRMSGRTAYSATIWSRDVVTLPPPYEGAQRLTLTVGKDSSGKALAFVGVPRGQFGCMGTCDIRVRFDDGAARFIAQMQKSKTVTLELPFFDFGAVPVEFKAGGLPWGSR